MTFARPTQFLRSDTPNDIPTPEILADGQIALNTADEAVFIKNAAGTVVAVSSKADKDQNDTNTTQINISALELATAATQTAINATAIAAVSTQVGTLATQMGTLGRNLLQFGALTTGNTADGMTNYHAFVNAIAFLSAFGGGELFVPPGNYALNVAVPVIVPSNITIRGVPGSTVIFPDVSTVVDVATRPFPLASGAVFVAGNPSTGQRAATVYGTQCTNVHFEGIEVECVYTQGTLTSGQQLRGIEITDTEDASVTNCRVQNLPNTGIYLLGCIDFRIQSCRAIGCGYGQPDNVIATRNGISSAGYSTFANRLSESYSGIVSNNICNYNHDEGIQYGFTCGMLVESNVCIGNGDLGIEGDTSFATTVTAAQLGHEVPSQAMVIGNYIDGRKADGTLGGGGIGFGGGNEGTATIANNIIRHISGNIGISATQKSGGSVTIENNLLEYVDPGVNRHQIQVSVAWARIVGNTIRNPGSTHPHDAIFCFSTVQNVFIEDNYSDAVPFSFIRIGADNPGFSTFVAKGNTSMGSGVDSIVFAPSVALNATLVDISDNTLYGVNASAAATSRAINIKASSNAYLASVASFVCRGNTVAYAGATLYPVGFNNLQGAAVANVDIRMNNFGIPTMPTGVRSYDTGGAAVNIVDQGNVINNVEIQSFAAYNLYTDSADYERGTGGRWISNEFTVGTERLGAGVSRALAFEIGGIKGWKIDTNGHFQSYIDSFYDFGTSTNRVRQIRQNGIHVNSATVVSVPTTGQTVTVSSTTNCQICQPAGVLAALTVQFPVQEGDGHELEIVFTQAITALTLTPGIGQSIVGSLTTSAGYLTTKWRFVLSSVTWYRIQ